MSDQQGEAQDQAEPPIPLAQRLPRWHCHKQVNADKIIAIEQAPTDQERMYAGGDWILVLAGGERPYVGHEEFILRHKPEIGGYYVVYADGYRSYSPAKAFEDGYAMEPPIPAIEG